MCCVFSLSNLIFVFLLHAIIELCFLTSMCVIICLNYHMATNSSLLNVCLDLHILWLYIYCTSVVSSSIIPNFRNGVRFHVMVLMPQQQSIVIEKQQLLVLHWKVSVKSSWNHEMKQILMLHDCLGLV